MRVETIFKAIRIFLFSNLNKQFLVFLFFLFLAGIFWMITTLNETYEREIKIPVKIDNVPKHVVLISAGTDTLRVTVRDKGWAIFSYLYGNKIKSPTVNFRNYDKGNGRGSMSSSDVKRLVQQELLISSTITAIKPEKLEFTYNNGEHKRVPVRWAGRISPDPLYFISEVEYLPDSVDVYASREKLDSITTIYTEQLNHTNFRDSLLVDCHLSHPNDVKVVPERVHIKFQTDVLTEETIDGIPIQALNVPEGKVLRTFPPRVNIHFVTGAGQIRSLRPEDFLVVADFREITEEHRDKCRLYLQHVPHGISRAKLAVSEVDYLIEEE